VSLLSHLAAHLLSCLALLSPVPLRDLHSFPTRRSSDLADRADEFTQRIAGGTDVLVAHALEHALADLLEFGLGGRTEADDRLGRSEEHTSELQSRENLVCRLLLEKKKKKSRNWATSEAS